MRRSGLLLVALVSGCHESSAAKRDLPAATTPAPAASSSAPTRKSPRCPEGMSPVGKLGVCIDRYEAHLVDAKNPAKVHSPYERPSVDETYAARSSPGVVPQAYVNRLEASAACEAAGKRLCRAAEWYRACSGSSGRRFPYGNDLVADRCNTGKGHALTKLFGHVTMTYDAHYNSPRVNQQPGFLDKTGADPKCVTENGAFDMVGNLHEWVADDVSAHLKQELPLEKGDQWMGKRGMGIFMGGYFSSHAEHGHGCLYVTATHAPDYHDYSTGFRCCAPPE